MSRPTTLPATAVEILAGQHEASYIAEHLIAAYWLHGRDNGTSLFILQDVHNHLADLADAMGYTLTPKVAEASEAAA